MQHLRGESLQPHEMLWLDEGVGLCAAMSRALLRNGHVKHPLLGTAKTSREFPAVLCLRSSSLINSLFNFVSRRMSQHDPKKLEFIYNLRSRRPGSFGSPKGAKSSALTSYIPLTLTPIHLLTFGKGSDAPLAGRPGRPPAGRWMASSVVMRGHKGGQQLESDYFEREVGA